MMSGPQGSDHPPAILLARCGPKGAWRATAIMSADGEPIHVNGPSNAHAATPAAALQELLTGCFSALGEAERAATLVSIAQLADGADGLEFVPIGHSA